MNEQGRPLAPAFYATSTTPTRAAWADWWVLLHPPYTLWHLSYVAIGATIAPRFDGGRLAATLVAFFLAVGVCAHNLDELHGRPLRTTIPGWLLVGTAVASLAGAVALGVVGIARVGPGLVVFIVAGVVLTCGYNLELFGGRLHNDVTFAAAWGAFPVLTGLLRPSRDTATARTRSSRSGLRVVGGATLAQHTRPHIASTRARHRRHRHLRRRPPRTTDHRIVARAARSGAQSDRLRPSWPSRSPSSSTAPRQPEPLA